MKFTEMPYSRPDMAGMKQGYEALTERLKGAKTYTEARDAFLQKEVLESGISTQESLASVRHSIDTRDEFYDGEARFWNAAMPELEVDIQEWTKALLASPFRAEFEKEFGSRMFLREEMALKTFSPEIIPDMQQENDLVREYEKLLASAQIPFEGGVYTLSQLAPFKTSSDDERRLAAWKAEGKWYREHQDRLDDIYDRLVHLRDGMGKKLGYEGYTTLGYYRMGRDCYTKDDVEKFRDAVRRYVVPVAASIYEAQAKRLGKEYPMNYADNAVPEIRVRRARRTRSWPRDSGSTMRCRRRPDGSSI